MTGESSIAGRKDWTSKGPSRRLDSAAMEHFARLGYRAPLFARELATEAARGSARES